MADPLGSTTVPVIEPAACWPHAGDEDPNTNTSKQVATIIEVRFFSFTEISLCNSKFLSFFVFLKYPLWPSQSAVAQAVGALVNTAALGPFNHFFVQIGPTRSKL
jgi:hypothetical protein